MITVKVATYSTVPRAIEPLKSHIVLMSVAKVVRAFVIMNH